MDSKKHSEELETLKGAAIEARKIADAAKLASPGSEDAFQKDVLAREAEKKLAEEREESVKPVVKPVVEPVVREHLTSVQTSRLAELRSFTRPLTEPEQAELVTLENLEK